MNIICVTRDRTLLAFVAFKTGVKEPTGVFGYIYELHVAHNVRRKTLAFHLMQTAEKIIQESGQSKVALTVLKNNDPAKALYAKSGYSFAYTDKHDKAKLVLTKIGM
jgi:ribosomal protein S18 acetylase RimI-like enzyme